jgi:hypothetical protein
LTVRANDVILHMTVMERSQAEALDEGKDVACQVDPADIVVVDPQEG